MPSRPTANWYVDFVDGETEPDHQQNDGEEGYIDIVGAKRVSMCDTPFISGGNKGFYDAKDSPNDWKKIAYEFTTYSWCMASKEEGQCNTWCKAIS